MSYRREKIKKEMSASKIKLAIAIVCTPSQIRAKTVSSLFSAVKKLDCAHHLLIKEDGALHAAREQLVRTAIEAQCSHILFMDSDIQFESDAITRLLARNKDIIGVHYNQRNLPLTSTVLLEDGRLRQDHKEELRTCRGVATGFLLVNLDVFKKIPHLWFNFESDEEGNLICSEDFWFCQKAREAGYEIWVDLTIKVKHLGEYAY